MFLHLSPEFDDILSSFGRSGPVRDGNRLNHLNFVSVQNQTVGGVVR